MLRQMILGLLVGIPFGYALQRGRYCMQTAFRDILLARDFTLFRAYILAVLVQMILVHVFAQMGWVTITRAPSFWLAAMLGGFIFGIGMVLAGGCASGTWYRVGEGMVGSMVALVGFVIGATLTDTHLKPVVASLRSFTLGDPRSLAELLRINPWVLIALFTLVGGLWLVRSPQSPYQRGWSWYQTGLIIGVIAALAWIASGATGRNYGLSVVQPAASIGHFIASGRTDALNWGTFMLLGIPLGAFISARAAGEFKKRVPKPQRLVQQFGGGLIMGLGGVLAGGCNIGNGLTGASVFAISSILAVIFIILGTWTAVYGMFMVDWDSVFRPREKEKKYIKAS